MQLQDLSCYQTVTHCAFRLLQAAPIESLIACCHSEPEFICTLSMLGLKHDDKIKREKLETAALLLELHCSPSPNRPSAVFRVTGFLLLLLFSCVEPAAAVFSS